MIVITKAKTKRRRAGGNYKFRRIYSVAEQMGSSVKASLVEGLKTFRNRADVEKVEAALRKGDFLAATEAVPFVKLPKDLAGLRDKIGKVVDKSAERSVTFFPKVLQPEVVFSADAPRVSKYILGHTGELIQGVTDQQRLAVQSMVRKSLDGAIPPARAAKMVRDVMTLNERQSIALQNYYEKLAKSDFTPREMDVMLDAYGNELLDARCLMIARTETADAVNFGQLELWRQAADDGIIEAQQTYKEWVIDPGTACERCEALDGQRVLLDEQFDTDDGPVDGPTLHPHCNCMLSLEFEE